MKPHSLVVDVGRASARPSWFAAQEWQLASEFKLDKRREHWLAGRIAAKQLAMSLDLATDPRSIVIERPQLVIDGVTTPWRVSISHSGRYGAAAISGDRVGIDIEVIREINEAAAHFFLRDDEIEAMRRCMIPHRLLHFWCAKEAAWKARSDEFDTLKQLALTLTDEREDGLTFDAVETKMNRDLVVALTLPTS